MTTKPLLNWRPIEEFDGDAKVGYLGYQRLEWCKMYLTYTFYRDTQGAFRFFNPFVPVGEDEEVHPTLFAEIDNPEPHKELA